MDYGLNSCSLCPHNCGVNRINGQIGYCGANDKIKVALASIHKFEEPCISGKNGSGTIFFSCCNLRCVYCQNYKISWERKGKYITIDELSDIFIDLQNKNVNNINLVTPTMYALQIKEAIIIAKKKGLAIPIIYNCSGYENVETLKKLEGYIDVYLPDFKYADNKIAFKYSNIKNYYEMTSMAILEMFRQVGNPIFNNEGIIKKGLIIRHLILPANVRNTKKILEWIKENIGQNAYVSIMAQYFPTNKASKYCEINRKLSKKELHIIEKYLYELNLDNGYIQELEKNEEEYVPKFDI